MTAPLSHLCFTLAAPYGAWGAASQPSATTAWKATELDPPKSAIVGLLGAALGMERAGLGGLADRVRVAVRTVLRPVRDPRPDYHTISRAHRPTDRDRWSRFEELRPALSGQEHAGALLSAREYWSCGVWTVALTPAALIPAALIPADGPEGAADAALLDRLHAALRAPRWALYAGRKACTLGLPPAPAVLAAAGPVEALSAYGLPWERGTMKGVLDPLARLKARQGDVETLAWDEDYPGAPTPAGDGGGSSGEGGGVVVQRVWRRDRPDPAPLPGGRVHPRYHGRTERRTRFPVAVDAGTNAQGGS